MARITWAAPAPRPAISTCMRRADVEGSGAGAVLLVMAGFLLLRGWPLLALPEGWKMRESWAPGDSTSSRIDIFRDWKLSSLASSMLEGYGRASKITSERR